MRHAALWMVALGIALLWAGTVYGHDPYTDWRKPDNPSVSCCSNNDCRPTRAYMGDDGLWRAWDGAKWLTVPKEVVLPTDYGQDGRSHLCESGSFIFCFTPGQVRG